MVAWTDHDHRERERDLADLRADLERDERELARILDLPNPVCPENAARYIGCIERDVANLRERIAGMEAALL